MAHAVDRAFEDRHLRAQSEGDHRRVVADHAAADHDDLPRRHAGYAAEEQPAPADRLLQEVGARLRGKAAGDLAHRGEQRESAVRRLDGLVRDGGDTALDECAGQRLVGRDVEVGEEHEVLAQAPVLGLDRLLDLEQELRVGPHVVDRGDPRSDRLVRRVRKRAALSGAGLDGHLMAVLDQLERPRRRERDAVLVRLDLPGDADLHRSRATISTSRGSIATESARFRLTSARFPPLASTVVGGQRAAPGAWPNETRPDAPLALALPRPATGARLLSHSLGRGLGCASPG